MGLLKSLAGVILCVHILCSILGCYEMLGRKGRDQLELFVAGSLDQLVPEDHVLARVDRVLDLGWLREEVVDCYCADNGRPGVVQRAGSRLESLIMAYGSGGFLRLVSFFVCVELFSCDQIPAT